VRLVAACYNVQSFRAGVDRAVEVLRSENPDLVLVQECGPRRTLRRFARAMEMEVVSSHRLLTRVRNAFRSPPSPHTSGWSEWSGSTMLSSSRTSWQGSTVP